MGSVIVSEVVQHTAHYPHSAMLATPHAPSYQPPHPPSSSTGPSSVTPSQSSQTSSAAPPSQQTLLRQQSQGEAAQTNGHISQDSARPPSQLEGLRVPRSPSLPPRPSTTSIQSASAPPSPKRIRVKDLHHIQSFVKDEKSIPSLAATGQIPADKMEELPQYEISDMPVTDVIEMVAGLLTKITSTNDDQAERLHKDLPSPEYAAKFDPLYNGVLAFHGKNIPTISILSYLTRIHKYCPATYEVFLSLLVYFDRITEKANATSWPSGQDSARDDTPQAQADERAAPSDEGQNQSSGLTSDQRETNIPADSAGSQSQVSMESTANSDYPSPPASEPEPPNFGHQFVVDSFNIHRLIISGVTCASKFFSDVFYTNSRYAKVGGLPLHELNNLEVQFLLLNDFRLSIPVEQLEDYATMLVEFYVREVIAQRHDTPAQDAADITTN